MVAEEYTEAVHQAIKNGTDVKQALLRLSVVLARHGHAPLYGRILHLLKNRFEREITLYTGRVVVARESDAKKYKKVIDAFIAEHGLLNADTEVDENIIGGYVLEGSGTRIDASYKKSLLQIYKKLVA